MDTNALPTKRNLLLAKQSLKLAQKGCELLDMKHKALTREIIRTEKSAKKIREKLSELQSAAEHASATAKTEAAAEPLQFSADCIKDLNHSHENIPPYDLRSTHASFDEAFFAWKRVFTEQERLAQIEEALARLKARADRTKKRAAALNNISIPKYIMRIKYISNQLEEHERDEAVRFKAARGE